MAKAKKAIAQDSMVDGLETWDDKEPGKRQMHVIATHTMRERMPDATLFLTGAGPRGGINGFAARNVPLSAIALSFCSGTPRTDWEPLLLGIFACSEEARNGQHHTDRRSSLLRQPAFGLGHFGSA
jgi:hypothetical protein